MQSSSLGLHCHFYLIDDISIPRCILPFVSEHLQVQRYGFLDVSEGLLNRLALGIAAGQRRDRHPETPFFDLMDYD